MFELLVRLVRVHVIICLTTFSLQALWCSWVVKGPSHSFYFAGDTGYCNAFEQIGRTYGPFSLAALPIGAYEPRSVFKLYSRWHICVLITCIHMGIYYYMLSSFPIRHVDKGWFISQLHIFLFDLGTLIFQASSMK